MRALSFITSPSWPVTSRLPSLSPLLSRGRLRDVSTNSVEPPEEPRAEPMSPGCLRLLDGRSRHTLTLIPSDGTPLTVPSLAHPSLEPSHPSLTPQCLHCPCSHLGAADPSAGTRLHENLRTISVLGLRALLARGAEPAGAKLPPPVQFLSVQPKSVSR